MRFMNQMRKDSGKERIRNEERELWMDPFEIYQYTSKIFETADRTEKMLSCGNVLASFRALYWAEAGSGVVDNSL